MYKRLKSALSEIASEERQRTIWLGSDQNIIVTPEELIEGLYWELRHSQVHGKLRIQISTLLEIFISLYEDSDLDVEILINKPEFQMVRTKAANILKEI